MSEVKLTDRGKDVLFDEVQKYYKSFGSMNKNDFEVLLLHVLLESSDKEMSNYELSRALRIPETKVKRLRYEVDLKYGTASKVEYREEKLKQLNQLLTNVSFKNEGKHVEFVVEDIAMRQFLDNLLKSHNRFSDSSFNAEIVKIDLKDLAILLQECVNDKKLCDQILNETEKQLVNRVKFTELLPDIIKLLGNATSIITDFSLSNVFTVVPAALKLFTNRKNKQSNY